MVNVKRRNAATSKTSPLSALPYTKMKRRTRLVYKQHKKAVERINNPFMTRRKKKKSTDEPPNPNLQRESLIHLALVEWILHNAYIKTVHELWNKFLVDWSCLPERFHPANCHRPRVLYNMVQMMTRKTRKIENRQQVKRERSKIPDLRPGETVLQFVNRRRNEDEVQRVLQEKRLIEESLQKTDERKEGHVDGKIERKENEGKKENDAKEEKK